MRVFLKVLMLASMIALAGANVCAEDMIVNIKQPFHAGGKSYRAGRYKIFADPDNDQSVNLINVDTKTGDEIRFSARLSAREGDWGEVVFDKVGDEIYLSEVYLVGLDGYLFHGAPGKHKHLVVKEDILAY